MSRRSLAGRVLPATALVAALLAAPHADAQRVPALVACAPLPDSLVSPEGPGPLVARSGGRDPGAMALDEGAGRVYINTATALLVLDAASGACLRAVPLNLAAPGPIAVDGRTHVVFAVRGGPDTVEGGTHLIFAARGASIVAFAGASGARLATVPTAARVWSLLVSPGGDRVLGVSESALLVLDGRTGALLRRAPLSSPINGQVRAVALWDLGTVYVADMRSIMVLDAASGALRRTIPLAAGPLDLAVDARTRHLFVAALPPGNTPASSYSLLAMFDAATGAALHQERFATSWADYDSTIVAVDGPRGHLLVSSNVSTMHVIDTRTGAALASAPAGGVLPVRGALAGRSGQVFLANLESGRGGRLGQAEGSLSVFDAATVSGRHLTFIGYSPTGLVVDQTTRRLFVTTAGTIADSDGYAVAGTVLVFDIEALVGVGPPQALPACVPLPATLVSPAGRGLVAARSAGANPAAMALDEAAGRVYINTATALLVLDAANGACLRAAPLDAAFPGPIAVDLRTHVVFAVRGASIAAFAGASGARLATVPTGAEVTTLLADPRADRVLGISGAELLVLDGRTGALLRRAPLPFPTEARVPVAALWDLGAVYVAEPRAIAVLDAASGALRRAIPLAATPIGLAADARTRHLFVTALPPVASNVAIGYSLLTTFDAASGATLRQVRFTTSPESPDSTIVAVDGPRGHLFVSSDVSTMNMVDTRTGAVLATAPADPLPQLGTVAERAGRVFVANLNFGRGGRPGQAQGSLSAFDAATGAGRQLTYIGYSPTGLVADETTGRIFVTTAGTLADNDQSYVAGTVLVFDLRAL